jgi:hypothetical protein
MCNCFFLPALGRPACILLAHLHPAGALEFQSSTFVAETKHICSRTNKFIFMFAAIGLASRLAVAASFSAAAEPSAALAARASGSERDIDVAWARSLYTTEFLNISS